MRRGKTRTLEPMYRTVAAFLISPLAPLLLAGIATPFVGNDRALFGPAIALTALYAYPAAIVIGVPLYFYARHKSWLRWWQVLLQASLIGALIPGAIIAVFAYAGWSDGTGLSISAAEARDWATMVGLGVVLGSASGALFWLIAQAPMGSNSVVESDARQQPPRAPHYER